MLKSKRKKDDQSPSKKALSSDYDHDHAINSEAETPPGSGAETSMSSGSKSTAKNSKKSSKAKVKKSDEVSIKMPATVSTPKTRKPPSRFSLRGLDSNYFLRNALLNRFFTKSSSNLLNG